MESELNKYQSRLRELVCNHSQFLIRQLLKKLNFTLLRKQVCKITVKQKSVGRYLFTTDKLKIKFLKQNTITNTIKTELEEL